MSAWESLESFSHRFSLRHTVETPLVREIFEPTAAYANALIGLTSELRYRDQDIQNRKDEEAIEELERYTHRLTDSILLGLMGLYNSGAVVLRSGVTAIFNLFEEDPGVWRSLSRDRQHDIRQRGYRMGVAEIRDGLNASPCKDRAWDLYRIYNELSRINYGDVDYEEMAQYLRSIPRTVPESAERYKRHLERSSLFGGDLILIRFHDLHQSLHILRFNQFNHALDHLRTACGEDASTHPLRQLYG